MAPFARANRASLGAPSRLSGIAGLRSICIKVPSVVSMSKILTHSVRSAENSKARLYNRLFCMKIIRLAHILLLISLGNLGGPNND